MDQTDSADQETPPPGGRTASSQAPQVAYNTDSYKQVVEPSSSDKQVVHTTDEGKQVVTAEGLSGSDNAPMAVAYEEKQVLAIPTLAAGFDKETATSSTIPVREDTTPIAMRFHEQLVNDIKGAPPAYNSLASSGRSASNDEIASPLGIEPDGTSVLPPRPEDRSMVGQLLSWIPAAPRISPSQLPPLAQPVVIPQIDVPPRGENVPFARCYSDALAAHGVSMKDFVAFLDGLAVAQAPNSALQGLRMFGAGATFVPIPLIPLAGRAISALASSGSGHSSSRARLYIERAKKEYFAPRGLRLLVVEDDNLNPRLQIPAHAHRLAPLTKGTLSNTLCDRRSEALAPYTSPLRYDIPEDGQIQGVHRLARKHLHRQLKKDAQALHDLRQNQWLDITSDSSRQRQDWDTRYTTTLMELRLLQTQLAQNPPSLSSSGKPVEAMEVLRRQQRDLQILISERQMALQSLSTRGRAVEAEIEEEKRSRRLKWIVIENAL